MTRQDSPGPRGNAPGPGPVTSPEEIRKIRRRSDRMIGIMLFIIGGFATVVNMTIVTADGLAQQASLTFEMYGLGEYHRPDDLEAFGWVGMLVHPLNYAVWLYIALKRWQRQRFASWCAFVGAGIALVLTMVITVTALTAHPEIVSWIERGAPTSTVTP